MGATPYGENQILQALLTGGYLSLHSGAPTGVNEVAGNGYARVAFGAFTVTPGDPSTATNNTVVEFPVATGAWAAGVNLTHFAVWDAGGVGAGNMRLTGTITVPKPINNGDVARFPIGALLITAD